MTDRDLSAGAQLVAELAEAAGLRRDAILGILARFGGATLHLPRPDRGARVAGLLMAERWRQIQPGAASEHSSRVRRGTPAAETATQAAADLLRRFKQGIIAVGTRQQVRAAFPGLPNVTVVATIEEAHAVYVAAPTPKPTVAMLVLAGASRTVHWEYFCSARARSTGSFCRCTVLAKGWRCRLHGGASTGPRR